MADAPKTLEMRVAELEDKLSKLHISEDEMKAYQKVAAALGTGPAAAPAATPHGCVLPVSSCGSCFVRSCGCWSECRGCIISSCIHQPCAIFAGGTGGSFGSFGGGG